MRKKKIATTLTAASLLTGALLAGCDSPGFGFSFGSDQREHHEMIGAWDGRSEPQRNKPIGPE